MFDSFCNVDTKILQKPTLKEEIDKNWRLVLHDDPIHTIQQVVDIINTASYYFLFYIGISDISNSVFQFVHPNALTK